MSADVKQQDVKRSGGLSYKEVPSKLERQGKKGVYFSFDFGSSPFILILSVRNRGVEGKGGGGCLMDKIH